MPRKVCALRKNSNSVSYVRASCNLYGSPWRQEVLRAIHRIGGRILGESLLGLTVQIANPASFLAQETLIHEQRDYKDRAKD